MRVLLEDRKFEGYDLEGVLRQVQAPTLLLYGASQPDSSVRVEDADLAQTNLSHGTVVAVPGAGHMLYEDEEQTDAVVGHLRTFLHGV